MRINNKGFTLIELIVVIVIIGILASIAAPMMSNLTKKAIASEVIVTLGAIRTAIKIYYAEHGVYSYNYADLPLRMRSKGDSSSDLDGTYFSEECYTELPIWEAYRTTIDTYLIRVVPNFSDPRFSPRAAQVTGSSWAGFIGMDENGKTYSTIEGLGLPSIEFLPA